MITKKKAFIIFLIFLLLHLAIWTLIPTISNINLPLDTIEALAWSSELDWGYNKHPPVSAYAVEFVYQIFGNNDWAYYFLSQVFVVISFIYVWKFSNLFLKNRVYSLLSILILESIFFFNYTTPEFNVYVCQLPFRIMAVYYCWKSITNRNIIDSILFGFFSALGFLTHYSFVFLLLALTIYYIYLIIKKKKIIELNLFLPIIIFLLILIPHLNWLFENNFSTISYALDRTGIEEKKLINHFINPIIFIIKQFLILIPFLIVFFLIYEKNKKRLQINIKDKNFLFLTCVNILPILMVFCISIFTGAKIRTMWMSTFYLLSGTYLFYLFENKINLKKIKKFFYTIIFLFIFSPLIYLYVSLSNDFKRTDYPGKEIASLIQNKWDRNFVNEIKFVIGDEWAAGNLSYHLSSRPIWMYDLKDKISVINKNDGVIYAGNPDVLKKVCPGVFGAIKPIGYCLIGNK